MARSPRRIAKPATPGRIGYDYVSGVHVVDTAIWCDAARARGVSFLSRADVVLGRARPERLITTEATVELRRRLGLPAAEDPLLPRPGRPFALGRARLELLPSGILPGAAQLLVELDGWRGLYAGLVSPRPRLGAEPMQLRACDEIVLDAPEAGGVVDSAEAIAEALDAGSALLPTDGLSLLALLAAGGERAPSLPSRWAALAPRRGRAVAGSRIVTRGGRRVIAGRREPGDDALALGQLPSVEELVRVVLDSGARLAQVRLTGRGPLEVAGARELLAALQRRGIAARVLAPPEQLSLFPR